jgi:signal transduction histidine kinase
MKLKKGKTVKIGTVLLIGFNILIVLSLISVSSVWYSHDRKELNSRIEFIKEQSLKDSKNYLVEKVNHFIDVIDFLLEGHKSLSEEELKTIVLQYATTQHFKNGGYIFINTLDGQALVFDGKIVEGFKDVSDMTDKNGKRLFDIERLKLITTLMEALWSIILHQWIQMFLSQNFLI